MKAPEELIFLSEFDRQVTHNLLVNALATLKTKPPGNWQLFTEGFAGLDKYLFLLHTLGSQIFM